MIRAAEPCDFPVIVEMGRNFHAQTAYQDIPYCADSALKWFEFMSGQGMLLVAETAGKVVGVAGGVISPCILNEAYQLGAELLWWVEPEYRKTSAGARLLAGLEQAARDAGAKRWSMIALEAVNPEAVGRMYLKSGYTPTERTFTKVL
jgi:GNAT superfamily N-acetyltransferase